MFDRLGIYQRFAECYSATYLELAEILGLVRQTTHNWQAGRYPIPWIRLKMLVDDQDLRWDWLIEGRGPKHRRRRKGEQPRPLDRHIINQHFLSLFPNMTQKEIADQLKINQTTVFKWANDYEQVPWKRLKQAVDTKGVTWEWLLEGRE